MGQNKIRKTLYFSLTIYVLLILTFFVPTFFIDAGPYFPIVAILSLLFLLTGFYLFFLAHKSHKQYRKYLLITAFFSVAPLLFAVLHNLFYALGILIPYLSIIFEFVSGITLIISVLISPVAFPIIAIITLKKINK